MKLFGILCWYEESPAWLAATVASCARVCDHLVAVDGGYELFPGTLERPSSGPEQADSIVQAAHAAGIGLTLHIPNRPFAGNEVEKRTLAFRIAESQAEPMRDWYLVLDGDELVSSAPADLHARLEATERHVAQVTLWQRTPGQPAPALDDEVPRWNPHPIADELGGHRPLFRAIPGLRVAGAHYVNLAELDGETIVLRGRTDLQNLAPAENLLDLQIEHRHLWRAQARDEAARAYLDARDRICVERLVHHVFKTPDDTFV